MRSGLGFCGASDDYFVLQINGEVKSCHRRYTDALTAALQLRRRFPLSIIRVREASEVTRLRFYGDEEDVHSWRFWSLKTGRESGLLGWGKPADIADVSTER